MVHIPFHPPAKPARVFYPEPRRIARAAEQDGYREVGYDLIDVDNLLAREGYTKLHT